MPAYQLIVEIDHNPALFEPAKARFTGAEVLENQEGQGAVNMGLNNLESQTQSYRFVLMSGSAIIHEWDITLETEESWQVIYEIPSDFFQSTEIHLVVYHADSEDPYRSANLRIGD